MAGYMARRDHRKIAKLGAEASAAAAAARAQAEGPGVRITKVRALIERAIRETGHAPSDHAIAQELGYPTGDIRSDRGLLGL